MSSRKRPKRFDDGDCRGGFQEKIFSLARNGYRVGEQETGIPTSGFALLRMVTGGTISLRTDCFRYSPVWKGSEDRQWVFAMTNYIEVLKNILDRVIASTEGESTKQTKIPMKASVKVTSKLYVKE